MCPQASSPAPSAPHDGGGGGGGGSEGVVNYALAALHYLRGQSAGVVRQFVSSFFLPLLCAAPRDALLSADAYLHVGGRSSSQSDSSVNLV